MKLSTRFNPLMRNAETPKDMILEDGEGGRIVFKVLGLMSQAFRDANEADYENEADKGLALTKSLVAGLPKGLELADGNKATMDNIDQLFEENPWLINTIIDFAKEHAQFDPKP